MRTVCTVPPLRHKSEYPTMQAEQLLQVVIAALEELKGQDIVTIDVRGKTSITDKSDRSHVVL